MRFFSSLVSALLLAGASSTLAASSWSFSDATVTVRGKGAEGSKTQLAADGPQSKLVVLNAGESLRLILTTTEGKKPKRPHQAFLTLRDLDTGLEESFPLSVKENGKGKVDLTAKELPAQFLASKNPLSAILTIASFGSSTGFSSPSFRLTVATDPAAPVTVPQSPVRYKSLPEIHHIFRTDPKSPPKIITLVFTLAVLAALPVLIGAWGFLGANIDHLSKAMGAAPVAHALFYGSIVAIEGTFYLYYTSWNLFQTMPVAGAVGLVAFLSGSRALTEVQERRLAGMR